MILKKMLQAIINGQSTLKQELLSKIDKVDKKVDNLGGAVEGLDGKIDRVEKNLTERIDKHIWRMIPQQEKNSII